MHNYAIHFMHLGRPDLFLYKEGRWCKAEQRGLVSKERMTPLCFCWFAARILVECWHLLFWYLNLSQLTVRQQAWVTSTMCYAGGCKQAPSPWMLTSLPLLSQASTLGLGFFLAWNFFLILCCSQSKEFHFSMQMYGPLLFYLVKIMVQLTACELGKK